MAKTPIVDFPSYTGALLGSELLYMVAPGNAENGLDYNITTANIFKTIGVLDNVSFLDPGLFYVPVFNSATGEPMNALVSQFAIPAGNVPAGGLTNQFLKKNSGTDYDTGWSYLTPPTATELGGVFELAPSAGLFLTGVDSNGDFSKSAVAFSNITGSLALSQIATIADDTILSNISGGAAVPAANGLSSIVDAIISNTQGSILYRNASAWVALAPGTADYYLQTKGAGQNPIWAAISVAGTVTSVDVSGGTTGLSFSGGPITTSGTITMAGALIAVNGGTGFTSYAVGDILYASTTTALSKLAGVATGNVLISGGVSTAPSWGKVGLTTHVSGILPLANGGTGSNLSDPNADRIMFWDDSAGAVDWLTASTGLTITTTSITVNTASTSQAGISEFATTAEYWANTASLTLTTDQVWAAGALQTLTDAATIAIDLGVGISFQLTAMAGNRTLGNPTNTKVGQSGMIALTASAGNRTIAKGTNWKSTGLTWPISISSGQTIYISYYVVSSTIILVLGASNNPT